jgi:hypothetical protein
VADIKLKHLANINGGLITEVRFWRGLRAHPPGRDSSWRLWSCRLRRFLSIGWSDCGSRLGKQSWQSQGTA